MRLTETDSLAIRQEILRLDPAARIYLYGSRADDSKKGGDIDLLVLSEKLTFADKITLLAGIKEKLGEQKIDLIIRNADSAATDPFVQAIIGSAVAI
jgi:uncharacterized protein